MLVTASRGHSLLEVFFFCLILFIFFNLSGTFYENLEVRVECAVKMTGNAKNKIDDNVSGKTHISLNSIHFYLKLT